MLDFSATSIFWTACLAQLMGLVVLAFARTGQRCAECRWMQLTFFLTMAVIGCIAMAAFHAGSGCWASCGATLAMMAVGVTLDFPPTEQAGSVG